MDRVEIDSAGGYEKLNIVHGLSIPVPRSGEVLVRTTAVGVNYADCIVRMGLYASAKKFVGWPITPGFEFAGSIEAIGDGTMDNKSGFKIGDRVFGVIRFFAYSTHVVVPINQLYAIPEGFSMEEAAAFPAVFLTAYYGLVSLGDAHSGQSVLVHSAAGGVGSALVQLAKAKGCTVVGVVGAPHKVEAAKNLGADYVIDKSNEDLWARAEEIQPEGYDIVLDANGVSTLSQSYKHLASGGRLIVYGFHSMLPRTGGKPNWLKLAWDWLWTPTFNPLALTGDNKSVMGFNLSYLFHKIETFTVIMEDLMTMIKDGAIQPPVVTTYPFKDVVQAHKDIESGRTVGKLVLITNTKED